MGWQLKDGDARVITGLASQRAALGRPWLRQAARRRALVGLEPVWRPLGPVEVKKWGNDGAAVRSYLQGFPASAILVNEPRSAPLPSIRGARAGEQVTWSGHAQCPIKRFLFAAAFDLTAVGIVVLSQLWQISTRHIPAARLMFE